MLPIMIKHKELVHWANSVQGAGDETVAVFIADRFPEMIRFLRRTQGKLGTSMDNGILDGI